MSTPTQSVSFRNLAQSGVASYGDSTESAIKLGPMRVGRVSPKRRLGSARSGPSASSLDTVFDPRILRRMVDVAEFVDEKQVIAARLAAHGILPTPQRIDIAGRLLSSMQHLTAEQIREKVREDGKIVSKATVYNTLGLLVERGLVRQVVVESTQVFYDSNTAPHYHFYNVDDGTLSDLHPAEMPFDHLPAPPVGTAVDGVDIVIRVRHRTDE